MDKKGLNSNVQGFLAISSSAGFLAIVLWQQIHGIGIDSDLKQALIALVYIVFGFFLGSSNSSSLKTNAQINRELVLEQEVQQLRVGTPQTKAPTSEGL